VSFATGDRENVEKILKEEERGSYREAFLHEHSLIEIQQGRFHSAERLRQQAWGRTSMAGNADWWVILSALEDAEVGKDAQARRYERDAAGSPLDRQGKIALAFALARSGQTAEAGRLADQVSAERPADTLVQHYFVPTIRAAIKLRQQNRRQPSSCSAALPSTIWRLRDCSTMSTPPTSADSHTWSSAMADRPCLSSKS
jgi:hypothetical protein